MMIRRFLIIFSIFIFVAGCGWKLRGTIPWPAAYQNVYMEGYDPLNRNSFYFSLTKFFPSHVKIVKSEKEADAIISVVSERQWTRTVTGLAVDRDTEEVVGLNIIVQVSDKAGNPIMPATPFTRERDFTYDESNLLGKSTDLQNVLRTLRQEVAGMFMRRLEAVMRNKAEQQPE